MKFIKSIIPVLFLLITISVTAQQGINYKALIKDGSGNVVASQNVDIQFIIYEGVALTNNVYQETHALVMTDANGIVIVNIGEGATSDVFTDIDWGSDDHYLNVQIDTGGGLTDMGTTQFGTVPYALFAEKSNLDTLNFYYADRDGDGFGDKWSIVNSESPPEGFVINGEDCMILMKQLILMQQKYRMMALIRTVMGKKYI